MQVRLEVSTKPSPFVASATVDNAQDQYNIEVVPKFALGWRYSPIGMITVTTDGKELKQLLVVDRRTGKLKVHDEEDKPEDTEMPPAAGVKA